MPLFEIAKDGKRVAKVEPTTFPELKLWERQDLEAWVMSAPELAGGDFGVVTAEFDRFDRTSERLDVLGIARIEPGVGRLVVVELKREGTSTTADLQAIKYAAYVAAVQFADVVEMYAHHHGVSDEEARGELLELLGGSVDEPPLIDDTPRIVLVASDFRAEVTTTVLWLIDNFELDIRCVRLQPFAVDSRTFVHSETIIPLPEAEQYRLDIRRKRRQVEREQAQKARAGRLLPQLLDVDALEIGQSLYFRRDSIPADAPPWGAKHPLYRATLIAGEGNRTLEWTDPESGETLQDSPSLLAARLLHRLGKRSGELSSAGVNGMHYWTVDGEISLRDLGAEVGVLERSARHVDRNALREACRAIPAGRWTTYGDLANAIGVPGARQISGGWRTTDGGGGPEVARRRLEEEGLSFDAGDAADPERRWTPSLSV